MILAVQPVGAVEDAVLREVGDCARQAFAMPVRFEAAQGPPAYAWNPQRRQYSSFEIMRRLAAGKYEGASRVLGLTPYDLFIPALTFVFGQAQLDGRVALVSLARLKQEFYGLPPDEELLRLRLRKEVVHELGHTLGLIHCPASYCAMRLSTSILHVDVKQDRLCEACEAAARARLQRWRREINEGSVENSGR